MSGRVGILGAKRLPTRTPGMQPVPQPVVHTKPPATPRDPWLSSALQRFGDVYPLPELGARLGRSA
jgi:hypothetical protein